MTTRISLGGDFLTAASWAEVHAVDVSMLDSEAGNTQMTNAYVESAAFTPGAVDITGIAVKIAARGAAVGTVSVRLAQAGSTVAGTEVTINIADINTATAAQNEGGWYLFSFAAVSLAALTAYTVSAKSDAISQGVFLYRDATAGNWSRMLRTTTTGAPAATDILHVLGEFTGAGTGNNIAIAMNNTDTTDYGAGTDNLPAITIGKRGTLTYNTAASTYLKLSGDCIVYSGGTFTQVQTTSSRTAILEFDPVADGGNGLLCRNGSTVTITGATKTHYHLLAADAAVNATSITCDATPTGWLDNDEIVLASTTRTPAQTEKGTLNGAPSAAAFDIDGFAGAGGGLANAHAGTSPTQGEVCNITRNVKIGSATSTLMAYVRISPTAVCNFSYAEFYYIGENATGKYGITVETTTGTCSITYCSIHDAEDNGVYISTATGGVTFSDNVMWRCNSTASVNSPLTIAATSGTHAINNNVITGCLTSVAGGGSGIVTTDAGSTYTNNRIAGNATGIGFYLNEAAALGTFSGNVSHSNGSRGFSITAIGNSTLSTPTSWRNGAIGLYLIDCGSIGIFTVVSPLVFGNVTTNMRCDRGTVIVSGANIYSEVSYTVGVGVYNDSGTLIITGSSVGVSGAHTTTDLTYSGNATGARTYLYNTTLASSTEVTFGYRGQSVYSQKHDASSTTFKMFQFYGTILSDTTIRHTASGYSWKMTPNSATYKMLMPGPTFLESWQSAVVANAPVTVSAWVYKDATYNGNPPRLVVVGGYLNGLAADEVAPLTVAHSTWEQLSVIVDPTENGVVMFFVDCDGTAGNVYVDDVSVSQTGLPSSNNLDYPAWGLPMQGIYAAGVSAVRIIPAIGRVGL